MKTITKTKDQLPGILQIIAIPIAEIAQINGNNIVVPIPSNIFRFTPSADSGYYTCDHLNNNAGNYYHHTISAFIQGYDDAKKSNIRTALQHQHIIIIQNNDGSYTRLGTPEQPFDFTTGYKADGPGFHLRFTAETIEQEYQNPTINGFLIADNIN